MHPGSRVLWGCLAPPEILLPAPQLCQNGGLTVLCSNGETEKIRVGGVESHVGFGQKLPGRRKCETVRCCDATVSSFVTKVRGEVFSHFRAVAVKRHSSVREWLCGLPERIISGKSPWFHRKIISMLLILLFTSLAFFGLGGFRLSVYCSCFLPRTLV
jgi:hypothetical protein